MGKPAPFLRLAVAFVVALRAHSTTAVPFNGQPRDVTKPAISGYTYQGCYAEPQNGRALDVVKADDGMTLEMCAAFCTASNKAYFGVEYGRECWCGSTLATGASPAADENECDFSCPGDPSQTCGAGMRLSLYKSDSISPALGPTAKLTVGNFQYMGCYTDLAQGQRALTSVHADNAMTLEMCATFCSGSTYMGVEYAKECWCGTSFGAPNYRATDQGDCNMLCAGDSTSFCGGPGRLNLYNLPASAAVPNESSTSSSLSLSPPTPATVSSERIGDYVHQGCWTDERVNGRTLEELYASDDMTIETCKSWAASKGYTYFGIEYSRECWGGNTLNPASVSADATGCNMKCAGNTNEGCGGPDRLDIYHFSPAPPSSLSSAAALASSSDVPSPTSTVADSSTLPPSTASSEPTEIVITTDASSSSTFAGSAASSVIDPSSSPSNSVPSSAPQAQTHTLQLSDATAGDNAQVEQVDGKAVINLTPLDGGTATVNVPATVDQSINPDSIVVVELTYKTDPDPTATKRKKRAILSECTLTISVGSPIIYSGRIWTTDGNYTTVTSMPTSANTLTTLVIVQYCPATAVPIIINDVVVAPQLPSGTTSVPLLSTTSIMATTSSIPQSSVPQTTAAPTPSLTWYQAQPYQAGACSRSGSDDCILSGAPVATSGLLAAATPIPVAVNGDPTIPYELCARMCQNTIGCQSWALDRTLIDASSPQWKCYFYSGTTRNYAISYNPAYRDVVWFSKDCYGCMQQQQIPYIPQSQSSTRPTSSSTAAVSVANVPSTTPAPANVPVYLAGTYTTRTCSSGASMPSCTVSGLPAVTTDLVGKATAVPVPAAGNMQQAYEECAGICANIPACNAWALDRGVGVYPDTQLPSWMCYFYSGQLSKYQTSDGSSQYAAVVYFAKTCYACQPRDLAVVAAAPPVTSSPTSSVPASVAASVTQAPAMTAAAVSTFSAPAYDPTACTQGGRPSCLMSGAPLATSGLLAVATGVAAVVGLESPYKQCAQACKPVTGCTAYALEQGRSGWSCYCYSGSVSDYYTGWNATYASVVWFGADCYNCKGPSTTLAPSSTTVRLLTTSPTVVATTTSVPSSTSSSQSLTSPSSTRPGRAGITPATWVATLAVPTTVTETNCPYPTADQWYTAGCTLSGAPLQTSGLFAIATGVPAPPANAAQPFQAAYQACAQMCASQRYCSSWALDRGYWPADLSDWTCYFYTANARLMTPQNLDQYWIVWMDKQCYACPSASSSPIPSYPSYPTYPPSSTSQISSSSSAFSTGTSFITGISSTTGMSSATGVSSTAGSSGSFSTSASMTMTALQGPSTFAASAYTSGICSPRPNNDGRTPCSLSGWPTPTSMSGLLAVATGVAPNPARNLDFSQPFQVCARACASVRGCNIWAVDRGNWFQDMSPWTCYMYNMVNASDYNADGNYFRLTRSASEFSKYAWSVDTCFNCTEPAFSSSSSSSSSSIVTSFISSSSSSTSSAFSSGPTSLSTSTASAAANTVTTFSAPPLTARCSLPTVAQFFTNGCVQSGFPTATVGLIAVATGIAPNAGGDFNFDPSYQRCATICAGLADCQGYALDRTNTTSWSCSFYNRSVNSLLATLTFSIDARPVVWMSSLCYNCPVPAPPSSAVSSSSSTSRPASSSTSESASASASAIQTAACVRAASPSDGANCNVKGFRQPAGQLQQALVYSQADCAAYCQTLGATCKSSIWIPTSGWCGVYGADVWTAIGDSAVAGRAYKDYAFDEPGCWACPANAAVRYVPA